MEEIIPDIELFDWISHSFPAIEKIKDSYYIFKFINKKFNNDKACIVINDKQINIPDSAIFYINKVENTPLKCLHTNTEYKKSSNSYEYIFSADEMPAGILISFIIISSGEFTAFSFIHPDYLVEVYKFIQVYLPDYEKYLSCTINRLMNAVLEGTEQYFLSADAAKILFKLYPYLSIVNEQKYNNEFESADQKYLAINMQSSNDQKYKDINKVIGYAIWHLPYLARNEFNDIKLYFENTEFPNRISHRLINWTDIYSTILNIFYIPDDDLIKLEKLRKK